MQNSSTMEKESFKSAEYQQMNIRVKDKLKTNEYATLDLTKSSKVPKSEVWKYYLRIIDTNTGVMLPYVSCKTCENVLQFSPSNGTSGLRRHKCVKFDKFKNRAFTYAHVGNVVVNNTYASSSTSSGIIKVKKRKNRGELTATAHINKGTKLNFGNLVGFREKFLDACATFITVDMRPYDIVNGPGFRHLIDTVAAFFATNGNVGEFIPDKKSIKQKISEIAVLERQKLTDHLKANICDNDFAVSVDVWFDTNHDSFVTLKVHYIDCDWVLHDRVLYTSSIEIQKNSSETETILEKYGLNLTEDVTFVGDAQHLGIFTAGHTVKMHCIVHILNNVLETVFHETFLLNHNLADIAVQLASCRDLVDFIKREKLPINVQKSFVSSAAYSTLDSLFQNFELIVPVLSGVHEEYRIACIDRTILKYLIDILTPFKDAIEVLNTYEFPTLHRVIPQRYLLLSFLSIRSALPEPPYVQTLKSILFNVLNENLKLHTLHCVAVFLNPKMRSMKALTDAERDETLEHVRRLMESINLNSEGDHLNNKNNNFPYSDKSANSSRSTLWSEDVLKDDDEDAFGVNLDLALSSQSEIELYRKFPAANVADQELNLLHWWKDHSTKLPRLSRLAKRILAIPTCCSPLDRNLHNCDMNFAKLRSKVNPKYVDDILFARSCCRLNT